MSDENRKRLSKWLKELYLYPDGTQLRNTWCGIAWLISWRVGILPHLHHSIEDFRSLGTAYCIFAISMLIEFSEKHRRYLLGMIFHYPFLFFMIFMLMDSASILSSGVSSGAIRPETYNSIIWTRMLVGIGCSMLDIPKRVYDEKAAQEREERQRREEEKRRKEKEEQQERKERQRQYHAADVGKWEEDGT